MRYAQIGRSVQAGVTLPLIIPQVLGLAVSSCSPFISEFVLSSIVLARCCALEDPGVEFSSAPKLKGREVEGVGQMPITPRSVAITDQLTRALGEAVIGLGSNLPQDVQDRLFKEVVASQGESIKSQLSGFLRETGADFGPFWPPSRNERAG